MVKHHDFLLRINLNKNLDYDGEFEQIGGTGFNYLPLKGEDVIVGGISEHSMYYKTVKRQLGYVGESTTPFELNFQFYADRLDAEYSLAQINEKYKGIEILKYTGSYAHRLSEIIGENDNINYFNIEKTFPSKLEKGFYSGSIDDFGLLIDNEETHLIYKGKYNDVGIFGNHIGDCDISQTSILTANSLTDESGSVPSIAYMLGFEDPDAANPSSPKYWKNIIPKEYKLEDREGVEITTNDEGQEVLNVDTSSNQTWVGTHPETPGNNSYYYPVLPKVNEYGVFAEKTLGLQSSSYGGVDNLQNKPFGESFRKSWDSQDDTAPVLGNYQFSATTLNLDFSDTRKDDSLKDDSGTSNLGVLTGDYKIDFESISKEPTRKDMKHISEANSDKKAI